MGLSYNNNGNANWGDIISGSGVQQAQQAPQHQPQPQRICFLIKLKITPQ